MVNPVNQHRGSRGHGFITLIYCEVQRAQILCRKRKNAAGIVVRYTKPVYRWKCRAFPGTHNHAAGIQADVAVAGGLICSDSPPDKGSRRYKGRFRYRDEWHSPPSSRCSAIESG